MTSLQEYEFKPVHTIKDHGIYQFAAKVVNSPEEDSSRWEEEIDMYNIDQATPTTAATSRYIDVQRYLEKDTLPSNLSAKYKRVFRLKYLSY